MSDPKYETSQGSKGPETDSYGINPDTQQFIKSLGAVAGNSLTSPFASDYIDCGGDVNEDLLISDVKNLPAN